MSPIENDSLLIESSYGDSSFSLNEYIRSNVFPVLFSCKDSNNVEIQFGYVALYISENGRVESVSLKRFNISKECEDIVINVFKNMGEWAPASRNGVRVKSRRLIKLEY